MGSRLIQLLAFANYCLPFSHAAKPHPISVSGAPPVNVSAPIPEAFVSFSIEFVYFPDFAGTSLQALVLHQLTLPGNSTSPNTFSNNLLNNLGNLTGTKPYIRVGGNTQDYALYNASLKEAVNGTIIPSRSPDYPTVVYIGDSYFDSYNTWPDTKFIHGFNLGLGGNNTAGWETLLETVPLACKALGKDKLLWWEYGNEPDLYSTSAQGPVRPSSWNESTYVQQWLNGTRAIKAKLAEACPELLTNDTYGYMAPSFAGTNNYLKYWSTWEDGLDTDDDIKLISSHNYIGGATQPGVTLQGTLLNHTMTMTSISTQVNESNFLASTEIPFILGETNSLYNQGKPGLSDTFGAALWGIDFNLWCASVGIRRTHMHMGVNYRYASWQPIQTNITTIGTKAPYYGNIVVAAMMGNLVNNSVQIANIPLQHDREAAYAAYENGKLARIAVINMRQYNYTVNGTSSVLNPVRRHEHEYSFKVPNNCLRKVSVQRLYANGSDAISGISWDGLSYNWELDEGKPVRLHNVTTGEKIKAKNDTVTVKVPDSAAVILSFEQR